MKLLLCTAALALFSITNFTASDLLYKYSFEKEVDGLDKKITVTIQCIEPLSQDKIEQLWRLEMEPEIQKNIDDFKKIDNLK